MEAGICSEFCGYKSVAASTLGPLEAKVMDIAWSMDGWVTGNDVIAKMDGRGVTPLAYTTVKTVLGHLADKKLHRNVVSDTISIPAINAVLMNMMNRPARSVPIDEENRQWPNTGAS
jgi:predicted transcriptional regulator